MLINDSLRDLIKLTNDDRYICMHDWWCSLIASAFGRIGFIDNQQFVIVNTKTILLVHKKNLYGILYIRLKSLKPIRLKLLSRLSLSKKFMAPC